MTATWWKIDKYGCSISPLEVTGETNQYLRYVDDSRSGKKVERRIAKGDEYHRTFAEARQALINLYAVREANLLEDARRNGRLRDKAIALADTTL